MPVFESANNLYNCFSGLFELMRRHPQTQGFLETVDLTVRFVYTDPEATITLVAADGQQSIYCGECDKFPDVQLVMTGDVAHRFWMGNLNVMSAISTRQIVPIGSLANILTLKTLHKAAIELYPKHFQESLSEHSS